MRRLLSVLVVMGSIMGAVGCHTCDVCDDCGDLPASEMHDGNCSSCGTHATVKPMPTNIVAKSQTGSVTK